MSTPSLVRRGITAVALAACSTAVLAQAPAPTPTLNTGDTAFL